jgi:hypothetical protein
MPKASLFFYPVLKLYLRAMKRLVFLLTAALVFSCHGRSTYPKAENALDAGREFIDGFLKGDTRKAEAYMVDDEKNKALLARLHRQLRTSSADTREGYQQSSIIIGEVDEIAENEVIIQYKSSFDMTPKKIKVVKQNDRWLVDLKYTLNPNM